MKKRTSRKIVFSPFRKFSTKTAIILGVSIIFIIIDITLLSIFISATKNNSQPPPNPAPGVQMKDLLINRQRWEKIMENDGPQKAYATFIEEGKSETIYNQHANAHIMGELLFDKLGIEGVKICDNSYAFGCYHSFFAKAIAKHGVSIITRLDQICNQTYAEKALGCSHGIGHGLLYTLGRDKLQESLKECQKLSYKEPIGGCTSGVFMEYNLNIMSDPTNSAIRKYDGKDPHSPCNDVPKQFRQACYYEMPQWWMIAFSDKETFSTVRNLCAEVNAPLERTACFRGAGNIIAPTTGYDAERTIQICQTMPTKETISLCLGGASWSFESEPQAEAIHESLCDSLPESEQHVCTKNAKILSS